MSDTLAVSTPSAGTAGEQDALSKAFDAAAKDIDFSGASFEKGAMDPPDPIIEQPIDHENSGAVRETEQSAEASTEDEPHPEDDRRNKRGRFRPTEAAKEAGKVDGDKVQTPALTPPQNWDEARKATFGKLPADAQKVVLDITKGLEAAHTRRSMELAEEKKFAEGVRALIPDGLRTQLRNAGKTELDGLAHYMGIAQWAGRDFPGYARWAFQQAKVDPRSVFPQLNGGEAEDPQSEVDPRFLQILQAHTQPLQQKLAVFERQQQEQARAQHDTKVSAAQNVINRFMAATDEAGNPKHPHYADVEGKIMTLCSLPEYQEIEDIGERLSKAYEDAVYLRPDLRQSMFDSEVQKREAARQQQSDVAKARRAAPVLKAGSNTGGPAVKGKMSLEEATRKAMSSLGA